MTRPSLLLSLALFSTLVVSTAAFVDVPFRNCNSIFSVSSLQASECTLFEEEIKNEKKSICRFSPGSKPTIKITFKPNEDGITDLETSVRAKFGKSTLPYAMTDFLTCVHGGISCPLAKDKEQTYSQQFHIDPSYPKGELFQVNWVIGKGSTKHVCLVFLAKIE